jgi:uncharacterized protein YprB with RNaseH-like and TPR domain
VLESTFQLVAGIGPAREQRLWRGGIACWDDLPAAARSPLPSRATSRLQEAITAARAALARRDADALAAMLPPGERWRLWPTFGAGAAYLDIETGDDDVAFAGISAIGLCDARGPRLFLAGRDLDQFPGAAAALPVLVTFNGLSFDVPILRQAFPGWRPPLCHLDLRHLLARVGFDGGLKSIERAPALRGLGLRRPDHLSGVDGWDAAWLWRRGRAGERAALRLFAEYNLYDTINLRTLMAFAYNALVEAVDAPAVRASAPRMDVPGRGDVLYDVSKILLSL